jgi:hypothetical protein
VGIIQYIGWLNKNQITMKNLLLFTSFLILIFGCAKPDPEAEKANAEAALRGFYEAAEKFDNAAMRTFCAEDFNGIENGHVYNNFEEFLKMAESLAGYTGQIKMDFAKTEIVKDFAFLIVKFDAVWTKEPTKMSLKTIENYILKKVNGKWLIHFWQSTYLPDEQDKKFSSIHLLNIPDNLPIQAFNDAVLKINAAIAKIGYSECGYTLLQITPDDGSKYNWVMEGKWKTPEVYKIIHENEEYKKIYEQGKKEIMPYFKDQISVKAGLP